MVRSRLSASQFGTFGGWAKGLGPALLAAILVATTFFAASVLAATILVLEGEDMNFSSPEVQIVKNDPDGNWSGGAGLKYTGVAAPNSLIALSSAGDHAVTIRGKARTDPAAPGAWPVVEVYSNNAKEPANRIATFTVNTTTLTDFTASAAIPQDTTKILVRATGNMAGDQIFWLDKVSLKPTPDTTPPQTTIVSGPSSASTTYNGDPSFSFSSSEPNSTFECKLDSGSWVSCTSPKSYSGLANGEHTFSVRAIDRAGNVDASPEIRQWRVWECAGKQIVAGDDLDAIVNADSSTVATTFCIHAGTYAIDRTVNVRTGDKLLGEEGATTKIGPATYPTDPPVKIKNGTNLPRLVYAQGENVTLKWLDVSGAQSLHNADGSYDTGTGVAIGAGQADHTSLIQWVVGHDNEGNAFGGTSGKILNVECFNNATDPVSLGWQGSCSKSHKEHEFAYSYIHDDFGNGIWCDAGCLNIPQQANGFWPHHNLIAGEGRFGIRYEHSPAYLDPGVYVPDAPATQPNATIEHNELHDNAYGGFAMHDAQNGVVRNNSFGTVTLEGISFAGNGDGGKAGQFSDGAHAHRTDLYNGEAYGNTLRGEYIQGCSKPDEIASCF